MKLFLFIFFSFIFLLSSAFSKENWILDKNISTIKFELPIFLASNVKGEFKEIQGLVEIDLDQKKDQKVSQKIITYHFL